MKKFTKIPLLKAQITNIESEINKSLLDLLNITEITEPYLLLQNDLKQKIIDLLVHLKTISIIRYDSFSDEEFSFSTKKRKNKTNYILSIKKTIKPSKKFNKINKIITLNYKWFLDILEKANIIECVNDFYSAEGFINKKYVILKNYDNEFIWYSIPTIKLKKIFSTCSKIDNPNNNFQINVLKKLSVDLTKFEQISSELYEKDIKIQFSNETPFKKSKGTKYVQYPLKDFNYRTEDNKYKKLFFPYTVGVSKYDFDTLDRAHLRFLKLKFKKYHFSQGKTGRLYNNFCYLPSSLLNCLTYEGKSVILTEFDGKSFAPHVINAHIEYPEFELALKNDIYIYMIDKFLKLKLNEDDIDLLEIQEKIGNHYNNTNLVRGIFKNILLAYTFNHNINNRITKIINLIFPELTSKITDLLNKTKFDTLANFYQSIESKLFLYIADYIYYQLNIPCITKHDALYVIFTNIDDYNKNESVIKNYIENTLITKLYKGNTTFKNLVKSKII